MAGAPGTSGLELALFDLDGTITRRGTLLPYVSGFLLRNPARLLRLPRVLPALARFAFGQVDRGELKSALIQAVFGGATRTALEAWTARFVPWLVAQRVRADARAAIAAHRARGDYLVLLSASTDLYVPAVAGALGFAETLCTGVEWDGDRLVGRLTTANRRGAEKARCLAGLRARHPALPIVAYGNAGSDLEHLRLADRAALVNGTRPARRAARRAGITCLTWR